MPRGRTYRFVATPVGQNPTSREFQRTVRSHVASISHPRQTTRRQARALGSHDGEGIIVFDTGPLNHPDEFDPQLLPIASQTGEPTTASSSRRTHNTHPTNPDTRLNPYQILPDPLSGNTFSPLRHLATYHKPYLPGIINHYIYNLTIPIPELDGNAAVPLFRAAWLPVVFHDPVVFQVVILFAATHYATYADPSQFTHLHLELLSLKQSALLALIQRVTNEQITPSTSTPTPIPTTLDRDSRETLIAAAAKMASYEAIFGTLEAFHLHMSTVTRLLRLQGGLSTLGMNGFLSRLLSFIDTNSAFLLGTNLYLVEFGLANRTPLHQPFPPETSGENVSLVQRGVRNANVVNLERFIGVANVRGGGGLGSRG